MTLDLFGNEIKKQKTTAVQRLSTRLSEFGGRDLYVTEPKDIERFLIALERDNEKLVNPIWEPAAGHGDISKTLQIYQHTVHSTDLYPYNDNEINIPGMDFMSSEKVYKNCKTIFTNPPFNRQEEFLLKALSFNTDVLFFVRLNFISSKKRYLIYRNYKPAYVYIYVARAHCYKNGDRSVTSGMVDYCIMWWKPPYNQDTIVRWIE